MPKNSEYKVYGERLTLFIDTYYEGSKRSFAEKLGIAESNLSKYANGKAKYSTKRSLERLEVAGLNSDWYLTGKGDMKLSKSKQHDNVLRKITVYKAPAYALEGSLINDIEELNHEIKEVPIFEKFLNDEDIFGFYASGNSMVGKGIYDGDLLVTSRR